MPSLRSLGLYVQTVRHLKPGQVACRLKRKAGLDTPLVRGLRVIPTLRGRMPRACRRFLNLTSNPCFWHGSTWKRSCATKWDFCTM